MHNQAITFSPNKSSSLSEGCWSLPRTNKLAYLSKIRRIKFYNKVSRNGGEGITMLLCSAKTNTLAYQRAKIRCCYLPGGKHSSLLEAKTKALVLAKDKRSSLFHKSNNYKYYSFMIKSQGMWQHTQLGYYNLPRQTLQLIRGLLELSKDKQTSLSLKNKNNKVL